MTPPFRLRLSDPSHADDWILVALMGMEEARCLIRPRGGCVGSAYLAGYAVECALKAFLTKRGIPRPTSGGDGHNLRALWAVCNFALVDLNDHTGSTNYFMTHWTTDLRYQRAKNTPIADADLVAGAGRVVARITTLTRRERRVRR